MKRSQVSLQDVEVPALVRMQAQEHEPPVAPQPPEEIQHEADVAVLRVELRLVEEVHVRRRRSRARSSMNEGRVRLNARTWYDW